MNDLSNKRIVKNTIFLYARMFLVMAVSLFTSRLVLKSLGEIDFGIYGVVGGFVAMFSVFSNSLSSAIQRFITYELGKGDINKIKNVFSTSVTIMIVISIVIMLIAEFVGWWFIHHKMTIPLERIDAAIGVMHCSVLTFGISLISVPYNATIISHEKMSAFAYVSVYEVLVKLIICYLLFVSPFDRLVTWAFMLTILQLSVRVIYGLYCKRHFSECSYSFSFNKDLLKDMVSYAGWSSFGLVALTCYTHGLNMILNIFFGPAVNAARTLAVQVQSAVQSFSTNFQVAMNPQIIKSYAQRDMCRMYSLIFNGTRYCFYILLITSLPIVLETPAILKIWLGDYPAHTDNFIRLILVLITFDSSLGGPVSTAQTATGNIKIYQTVVGGIMLTILPISYLILREWNTCPETVYIVYMVTVFVAHVARMLIIRRMINLSLRQYLEIALKPICFVSLTAIPLPLVAHLFIPRNGILSSIIVCIISVLCGVTAIYILGITSEERDMIKSRVKNFFHI